jgi:hypothetical protein
MKTVLAAIVLLTSVACFGQAQRGKYCPPNPTRAAVNLTASGDNTVIASNPAKRIFVWQMFLVNSSTTVDEAVTLKEGSTAISGAFLMKASATSTRPLILPCDSSAWAIVPKGSAFKVNLSQTGSLQGSIYYTMED